MQKMQVLRRSVLLWTLVLTACAERAQPLAPEPEQPAPPVLAGLTCRAVVATGSISCAEPGGMAGGARGLILGGQGVYVRLTSSNVSYSSGVFSADVTVTNLIGQVLGTSNGGTADSLGVRVFFAVPATVTSGTGVITLRNADGVGTFTASDQAYFRYFGLLYPNNTTLPKRWEWNVPPTVETFEFKVFVSSPVQHPNGWVEVQSVRPTVGPGNTVRLQAVVRNVLGAVSAGAPLNWQSVAPDVATIGPDGTVTGVAPGSARIQVSTAGSPTPAVVDVAVCPTLAPGKALQLTETRAILNCLPGGEAGAEYVLVPVNAGSAFATLIAEGQGLGTPSGSPNPAVAPASFSASPGGSPARPGSAEWRMDRASAASVADGIRVRTAKALRAAAAPPPAVGDLVALNYNGGQCSGIAPRVGRVTAVGTHAVVVSDTTNPAGGLTNPQYASIAAVYDTLVFPVAEENFGAPYDLDGNGRQIIFFTRALNEQLSPTAFSDPLPLGTWGAADLLPKAGSGNPCPGSNEADMFYMPAADPAGTIKGDTLTSAFLLRYAGRGLVHGLQHLTNSSRRMYVHGTGQTEEFWLDEGLSLIAEELLFYRAAGLAPGANVSLNTVYSSQRIYDTYYQYGTFNVFYYGWWLASPERTSPRNINGIASAGAIWAFLRYAADRRGGVQAQLWQALANGQQTGMENLASALGVPSALPWFDDWAVAVYADDAVAGVDTVFTMPSWNFRQLSTPSTLHVLTLQTVHRVVILTPGGEAYLRVAVPSGGTGTVSLGFPGDSLTGVHLTVLRIR
jgi:hypothetical protein